jgi:3-hydroxymyristoyl/3-hydroxydecanoyl-(acyl carrier protein) dehydratase
MSTADQRPEEVPFDELTVADGRAHAVVRRAHAERLCEGHFPGDPIVPGAYLAGLMVEVAAALVARSASLPHSSRGAADPVRLLAIENCVFARRVVPHEPIAVVALPAAAAIDEKRVDVEVQTRDGCAARARLRFAGEG